jgi:hypothetical protein
MTMDIVRGSAPIAAQYTGALLNPAAARAPGAGLATMGKGLADVGGVAGELAEKMAAAKNTVDLAEARGVLDQSNGDFEVFKAREPDETKWGPEAQRLVEKAKKRIGAMGLSPVAEQRVGIETKDYEAKFLTAVKYDTIKATAQRYRAKAKSEMERLAKNGRIEEADLIAKAMVRDGMAHKDERDELMKQNANIGTLAMVANGTSLDPVSTKDELEQTVTVESPDGTKTERYVNFTELTPDQRVQAINAAAVASGKLRAETQQAITLDIMNGDRTSANVKIGEALAKKTLLPSQAKYLRKQLGGGVTGAEMAENVRLVDRMIGQLPARTDPKFGDAYNDVVLTIAKLPEYVRGKKDEDLDRRLKTGETKPFTPSTDPHQFIENMLENDQFGRFRGTEDAAYEIELQGKWPWSEKKPVIKDGKPLPRRDAFGEKILDKARTAQNAKDRAAALGRKWEVENALTNFIRDHPQADLKAQMAFVETLTKADKRRAALTAGPAINPGATP